MLLNAFKSKIYCNISRTTYSHFLFWIGVEEALGTRWGVACIHLLMRATSNVAPRVLQGLLLCTAVADSPLCAGINVLQCVRMSIKSEE